jgi:hypothetical protein
VPRRSTPKKLSERDVVQREPKEPPSELLAAVGELQAIGRYVAASQEWPAALRRIEQGDHLTRTELSDLVRHYGIPKRAREYVADWILNPPKSRRGRRAISKWDRHWRAVCLAVDVVSHEIAFRLQGLSRPRDCAIRIVAKRSSISAAHLRDILKRDLRDKDQEPLLSSDGRQWLEGLLLSSVNDGLVRLDKNEGIVTLHAHQIDPAIQRYREEQALKKVRTKSSNR